MKKVFNQPYLLIYFLRFMICNPSRSVGSDDDHRRCFFLELQAEETEEKLTVGWLNKQNFCNLP